jgi:hypothetical protein
MEPCRTPVRVKGGKGQGSFVSETRRQVIDFEGEIVQNLKPCGAHTLTRARRSSTRTAAPAGAQGATREESRWKPRPLVPTVHAAGPAGTTHDEACIVGASGKLGEYMVEQALALAG